MSPEESGTDPSGHLIDEIHKTYLATVAVLGVVVLVTFGIGIYLILNVHHRVERFTDAARWLREAHEQMLDQETGLRGFLGTGEEDFLTPYEAGRKALPAANRGMEETLNGVDSVFSDLLALRAAQQRWQDYAEQTIDSGTLVGEDPEQITRVYSEGKALFDDYRFRQDDIATAVLALRDSALDAEARVLAVTIAAQVLLLLVAIFVFRGRFARLEPLVVGPIDEMVEAIDRLKEGDYGTRLEPSGVEELQVVARGLNNMAQSVEIQRDLAAERQEALSLRAESLRQILRLAREVSGNLNVRYVQETVASAAIAVSGHERVVIYLIDKDRGVLVPSFDSEGPSRHGLHEIPIGEGVVGEAASLGRRTSNSGGEQLAIPMVVGARVIGVIDFSSVASPATTRESLEVLETLAVHSATAIEAARLHEAAEELSRIDALTTLPNRRRMDEELELEVARSQRYERPLALVMADIDHFKQLNDEFGHQTGDEVLQDFSAAVADALRNSDTAYRYGGEEFVILVREASSEDAVALAERLRAKLKIRLRVPGSDRAISASFGVAQLGGSISTAEELISAADKAMYGAKKAGRDRVYLTNAEGDIGPATGKPPQEDRRLRSVDE